MFLSKVFSVKAHYHISSCGMICTFNTTVCGDGTMKVQNFRPSRASSMLSMAAENWFRGLTPGALGIATNTNPKPLVRSTIVTPCDPGAVRLR